MDLKQRIEDVKNNESQLLLIIGQPGSGKSKMIRNYSEDIGIPIIDLDKLFINTSADQLMDEMKSFLKNYHKNVLLLDNKKILYAKDNHLDILAFLKELGKDIIVVATWNGKIEDGQLYHFRKDADDLIYSLDKEKVAYILC